MNNFFEIILKFNQQNFEGTIIFILIIVFVVIITIWYNLVLKPKEKKDFNEWLINNKDKLELNNEINSILEQLSFQITPCNKCDNNLYQVWNIDSTLNIRCCNCKKKKDLNLKSISDVKLIFDLFITFYLESLNSKNELIINYIKNNTEWEFNNVRKGNMLYNAFEIYAKKEKEEITLKGKEKNNRTISQKVKNEVWNRDKGKCVECGSNEKLEFDHIIPFSKGGSNTYRNIQLLCENCNRVKSNKIG